MSCGLQALKQAQIPVEKYYASEIDKHAIIIAKKNHPEIVHVGDVTKVTAESLNNDTIDLLIGGSPCQGFSFAGKQLNFNDDRSKLFFEFVRLLNELKPKYFLLENVKMKKEYQDVISQYLGCEPIEINSALVSAQNRKRLYWTNIPNVTQPSDLGIVLKDILELPADVAGRIVGRRLNSEGKRTDHDKTIKPVQRYEINENPQKTNCLTTVNKDNILKVLQINPSKEAGGKQPHMQNRVYHVKGKSVALTAAFANRLNVSEDMLCVRQLTPVECERLQTLPDNYTEGVSKTQRYKMLGNGWTVSVIQHIFNGLKDETTNI